MRTTDVSIYTSGDSIAAQKVSDLKERVRIANETESAILLSIHQNNFFDGKYSGAQVFYTKTEGSERLAKDLQRSIVSSLNVGSNRQAKPVSGVYLMEHINTCGILIECGFISNPEEEAKLGTSACRKLKADLYIDDRGVGGLPDWGVIYEMIHNKWTYEEYVRQIQSDKSETPSFWRRLFLKQ